MDNNNDAETVGLFNKFIAIDDYCLIGFDDQRFAAVAMNVFDGIGSDGGDIEAAVLVWLGHFDQRPSAIATELTRAFDHAIGTFNGFDGNDFLFFDGDGL